MTPQHSGVQISGSHHANRGNSRNSASAASASQVKPTTTRPATAAAPTTTIRVPHRSGEANSRLNAERTSCGEWDGGCMS
jgi:hypothetical protein